MTFGLPFAPPSPAILSLVNSRRVVPSPSLLTL
uniref:Uncharacterized protein n=1 Tax=Siphoviridae sp. ctbvd11 TaxID=2825567 RepID=A0A8S5QDL0_9CAUD|nr:MAG TPA: hypothetical protein [Siphoviridae sp. ctbvd11]